MKSLRENLMPSSPEKRARIAEGTKEQRRMTKSEYEGRFMKDDLQRAGEAVSVET
jgi:hypothetical protein